MPIFSTIVDALGQIVGDVATLAEQSRARIAVGEALAKEPNLQARTDTYQQWMAGTKGLEDPREIIFAARVFSTVNKNAPAVALALDDTLAGAFGGRDFSIPPPLRTAAITEWSPSEYAMWVTNALLSPKNKDRSGGGPAEDSALRSIAERVTRQYANNRTHAAEDTDQDDPAMAIPYLLPVAQFALQAVRTAPVPLPYTTRRMAGAVVLIVRDPDPDDYLTRPTPPDTAPETTNAWWWAAGATAVGAGLYVGNAARKRRGKAS